MTQTVLLAGATGMLGSRLAYHLARSSTHLRLLVRSGSAANRVIGELARAGAELIEGDLTDPASLDRATHGVDVIVSAVQGGPKIITDGQIALAAAGKRNGVRRILPSDFGLDLFKATPGEHAAFDARRDADAGIAAIGLEQINILQGGFMELFMPGRGAVDLEKRVIGFFGDGERPIEVTSVEDTARMVARVALDRDAPPGKFSFAGDRISFRQAGEIVSARTGVALQPISYGSEADLRAAMGAAEPERRVMLAYLLYMTNGQTALTELQNAAYPDLHLESFADFAARKLAIPAPERVIPPPGATPMPELTPEQYRRDGMDDAPSPNPLSPRGGAA